MLVLPRVLNNKKALQQAPELVEELFYYVACGAGVKSAKPTLMRNARSTAFIVHRI